MKKISKKLTNFIIKFGSASEKASDIYEYGFQVGLETLSCFLFCFIIAAYMNFILEFIVFYTIFICLRSYAGGIHMNTFLRCFTFSVIVQTIVLLSNKFYCFPLNISWIIITVGSALIILIAPVGNINRELDAEEKSKFRKVTLKLVVIIIMITWICNVINLVQYVSLIAMTILTVLFSQYCGLIKYKIETLLV
ncbi:accessory gene regulator B family protein [Robinsoniella peoriensis]|uniref:accessory gene regulator B family protein n=1 Tax=Robinsoniella peoriensis TaxID=180332 RepID=UPI00085CDC7B|nr:accessory gene regulator B family protein [Robinsoniella peoriensis]